MEESPPVMSRFSSTMTEAPASAASTAALMPAMPVPTTATSQVYSSVAEAGRAASS